MDANKVFLGASFATECSSFVVMLYNIDILIFNMLQLITAYIPSASSDNNVLQII